MYPGVAWCVVSCHGAAGISPETIAMQGTLFIHPVLTAQWVGGVRRTWLALTHCPLDRHKYTHTYSHKTTHPDLNVQCQHLHNANDLLFLSYHHLTQPRNTRYTVLSQCPQLARVPSGRHFDKPLNCLLGHSIIFSQIERWGTGTATSYGFSTQVWEDIELSPCVP